jgi:copper chaperone CopZ
MKSIGITTFFAGLVLASSQVWAQTPAATGKTVKLTVDGMVCSFCAQGIEARLKQQAATEKVYVSLDERLVAVALRDGKTISDETLRAELKDAGYEVKAIARTDEPLEALKKARKK